jgi:hypothetical protein
MPTSLILDSSNSILHFAQTTIHFGICHLERVTAKTLESTFCTAPYQTSATRTIRTFM